MICLMAMMLLSRIVLSVNPYRPASERVHYLLESQPDLESRLNVAVSASAQLGSSLSLEEPLRVTQPLDPSDMDSFITWTAQNGIAANDTREFLGLIDGLGNEILMLSSLLKPGQDSAALSTLLAQARNSPEQIDIELLTSISSTASDVLAQIGNLRQHLQAIANDANLIFENPHFRPILILLQSSPTNHLLTSDPLLQQNMAGVNTWQQLSSQCESLEIQFANDSLILGEMVQSIIQAQQIDQRLGYSRAESVALWVNHHNAMVETIAALLFLTAILCLIWKGRINMPRMPHFPPVRILALQLITSVRQHKQITNPKRRYEHQSLVLVKHQAAVPKLKPKPIITASGKARLKVTSSSGFKTSRALPLERAFRIGTDPHNAICIPAVGDGFIEVWIRSAKVGHFLEVMFSEVPILLNHKPVAGARRLADGDSIQILDYHLVYQAN